jgi:hypothetical protein
MRRKEIAGFGIKSPSVKVRTAGCLIAIFAAPERIGSRKGKFVSFHACLRIRILGMMRGMACAQCTVRGEK